MRGTMTGLVVVLAVLVGAAGFGYAGNVHPEARLTMPLFRGPGADEASEPAAAELLVDLADRLSAADALALGRSYGLELTSVAPNTDALRFFRARVPVADLAGVLERLKGDAAVEVAEPDLTYYALGGAGTADGAGTWDGAGAVGTGPAGPAANFPDDPLYQNQWHLDQIHMQQAWKMATGEGVIVAVIDTGVAAEDWEQFRRAEDLGGTLFVPGWNFIHNNAHPIDDNGHGTHVAGTIAQTTNNGTGCAGVCLRAKIMPLKVLTGAGFGSSGAIAAAIRWAADNKAKVINMSLGSSLPSFAIKTACEYAHKKGVTIVCAAGNSGRRGVGYPAKFPVCIGVSATRYDEQITFYSSWGEGVDLAAPGGDTRVDQNGDGMPDGVLQNTFREGDPGKEGYYNFMGTSMASPHVAGVAALIVSKGVTDPEKVRSILKASARPKGTGPGDEKYGAGILDAAAALRGLGGGGGDADDDEEGTLLLLLLLLLVIVLVVWLLRRLYPRPTVAWAVGALLGALGLSFLGGFVQGGAGLLWQSAALPLVGLGLLAGVPSLRPFLAGLALGVAARLLWAAWLPSADVALLAGPVLGRVWYGVNGAAALVCALGLELRRAAEDGEGR